MSFQALHKSSASAVLAALAGLSLALTGCAAADTKESAAVGPASAAASATSSQAPAEPESLRGTFVRVITGDTLELSPVSDKNGQPTGEPNVTVHILGIKAPALDACGGPEAAAELKRIINPAGFFRVKFDPQSSRVDSKGNTQGYLYSGDGGGVSLPVGSSMVQNGYAAAWYDSTEDRSIELTKKAQAQKDHDVKDNIEAQKAAQTHKYGIWATCPVS